MEGFANMLSLLKLIAETVTAISTAVIVVKQLPVCIKTFFGKVRLFFCGFTDIAGKKVFGFKAIREAKERHQRIIDAVAPDYATGELLVLNKKALVKALIELKALERIEVRT